MAERYQDWSLVLTRDVIREDWSDWPGPDVVNKPGELTGYGHFHCAMDAVRPGETVGLEDWICQKYEPRRVAVQVKVDDVGAPSPAGLVRVDFTVPKPEMTVAY